MEDDTISPWGTYRLNRFLYLWLKLCHSIPPWPLLKMPVLWLRKPLKHIIKGPVDTVIWGLKLRIWSRGNLSEQRLLFTPQFLDNIEREHLKSALKKRATFVDIGANFGLYSLYAASLNLSGLKVIAIEPDPQLNKRLIYNINNNNIKQIKVINAAVKAYESKCYLTQGNKNKGENQVVDSGRIESGAIQINTIRLEDLLNKENITNIDYLKIDIEGDDAKVLEDLLTTSNVDLKPTWIISESIVSKHDSSIKNLLLSKNYQITFSTKLNTVYTNRSARLEP